MDATGKRASTRVFAATMSVCDALRATKIPAPVTGSISVENAESGPRNWTMPASLSAINCYSRSGGGPLAMKLKNE